MIMRKLSRRSLHMVKRSPTLLLRYIRDLAETGGASELPDRVLVERFASQRDEAAFAALVRRHGELTLSVCRRVLGQDEDAEDVFQAVFLVLSRKAATLRRKEAVGSWLFGVAHRLALRARQSTRKRREREARAREGPTGDVLDELTVREAQLVLYEELARLPEGERAPLVLCYLQGLTRDEAAQRLGCPLGTLKHRLERARERLHQRLTRRGIGLGAALPTLLLTRTPAPAISADLVSRVVQAGVAFASGSASGGALSLPAVTLAESALNVAILGKVKVAAICLLMMIACLSLGQSQSLDTPPAAARGVDRGGPEDDDRPKAPAAPLALAQHDAKELSQAIDPPPPRAAGPVAAASTKPRWRSDQWEEHARLAGHRGTVRALAFAADSTRLVSAGDDGQIRVWDVARKKELCASKELKAHSPRALALGAADIVAVGTIDGSVFLWDLRGEQAVKAAFRGRGSGVRALTFGDDGHSLAWLRGDGAVQWQHTPERSSPPPAGAAEHVGCVAFSRNGRRVAWGRDDGSVTLWDAAASVETGRLRIHSHQVWCMAFSADGGVVASADHFATLLVWDSASGRALLEQAHCKGGPPAALAFSPDGRIVALAAATGIHLWELDSRRKLADLRGQPREVRAVAFSPNGQFLAAAGSDGSVTVWAASAVEP